ncbi:MAG: serpin family protein [Anaerolineales bacterium]|nr:serpin family protein [Anaerolineales bacterium]
MRIFLFLAAAGLLLAACSPAVPDPVHSSLQRETAPNVTSGDLQTLVAGNNAFTVDLYQTLRSKDGNLFCSPFSISLALAMTRAGAGGRTGEQMDAVLHFRLPPERLHPAYNALDLELARRGQSDDQDDEPLQLNIANGVWAQQEHPFLPEYLDLLAVNYGAGIHPADFVANADAVRQEINTWISDGTHGRIEDLIPPGALSPLTRMVLANAIYFKADWQMPFPSDNTNQAPFFRLDGTVVQVEMMHNRAYLPYARGENFRAVELPYVGGTAAMDILVPDEGQLAAFEAGLDAETLAMILAELQPVEVELGLPTFTFRSQFSLAGQLAGLGMPEAFDPARADFSGMDGLRDLFISDVIHQAFVAVDEEGTEAAAATAVIMMAGAAPPSDEGVRLIIDRPFLFLIRDIPSGQILFIGRVLDPAE